MDDRFEIYDLKTEVTATEQTKVCSPTICELYHSEKACFNI